MIWRVSEFGKLCLFWCTSEKENLCFYGHANETWEVGLPAEEVPPELPEPALGINFARDGMKRKDWLSLVAVHTDSWLLSVAFYFGARLNRNERYILPAIRLLLMNYFYGFSESFRSIFIVAMVNGMPCLEDLLQLCWLHV